MYISRKNSTANLRLIVNLIVSSDTSTVNGEICWMTWLQNQEASGLKQRLIAWYQWRIDQCQTSPQEFWFVHTKLGQPIKLSGHYALSTLGTPDTPLRTPVLETPIQTVNLWCPYTYKYNGMGHTELTGSTAANSVRWTNCNNDDQVSIRASRSSPTYTTTICVQGQSYVTIGEQILEDKLVLYSGALVVDSSPAFLTC